MSEKPSTKTATLDRRSNGEYVFTIEDGQAAVGPMRLDLTLRELLGKGVTRIIYTDDHDSWVMNAVPFELKGEAA